MSSECLARNIIFHHWFFFLSLFLYIIQAAIYNELFCVIVIQVFVTWATVAAIAAAHTLSSSFLTLHNGGLLFRTDRCRKFGLCIVILKVSKMRCIPYQEPIPIITCPENILENSVKKVPKLFFGTVRTHIPANIELKRMIKWNFLLDWSS